MTAYDVNARIVRNRYKVVQYNILVTLFQWLKYNINHNLNTKVTPYLVLTGELWGVFCEDFEGIWRRYNGTAKYSELQISVVQIYIE